jgi:N-acyl-D-aspartate/D-glutamate deacylase
MADPAIIVRNGTLLDGTGSDARPADILIANGRISAVERPGRIDAAGREVIDADGLVLAPGFIDVHSHADNAPFLDDANTDTSKILQGVTTEVVGNCGFSLAPCVGANKSVLEDYSLRLFPPLPWTWSSFAELLEATDDRGYVTNYAPLVGHHALRIGAMGMSDAKPTSDNLDAMGAALDEAVQAGAFGLSSGLIYPPGLFSDTAELTELAKRLPAGLPYVTHMRGEGTALLRSIEEAIRIGRDAGRPVQVSHLKAAGQKNWGSMQTAIDRLDAARDEGLDIRHDVYPYTAGSSMLTATLPPWFQEGGEASVLHRLQDPVSLGRLRADLAIDDGGWENFVAGAGFEGVVVASTASHAFEGLSLAQIADLRGGDPVDALVHVLLSERLKVSMVVHVMREDDLELALAHPQTMIGSDGLPPGVGGKPHPRMYGTFPRILARYVRQRKVLTLAEAVRKMTGLPAETFGLADRGRVAPGMAADLVAFDAAAVVDVADYDEPVRAPRGIAWVMQNGSLVVRDGHFLGRRVGVRLRPKR